MDFKDHPVSLTEAKAGKVPKAHIWTPRDALIDLLRRIDNGENIDAVVICHRQPSDTVDGEFITGYNMATPDMNTGLGMLSRVAHLINAQ